jgi:hypothetical protein
MRVFDENKSSMRHAASIVVVADAEAEAVEEATFRHSSHTDVVNIQVIRRPSSNLPSPATRLSPTKLPKPLPPTELTNRSGL